MEGTNIDIEGGAGTQPAANAETNPANQEDTTSLDGGGTEDVTGKSNENQSQEETADEHGGSFQFGAATHTATMNMCNRSLFEHKLSSLWSKYLGVIYAWTFIVDAY